MDKGHWCSEHGVTFFKKGKMKNYAHPIGDTGQWCNEPEEGGDPIPEEVKPPATTKSETMSKKDWSDKDELTRVSIHKQVALKCASGMAEQGVIEPAKVLTYCEIFARWLNGDIKLKNPTAFDEAVGKHFIEEAH